MADLEQAATWHRQIAALVAAADRAGVAPDELPAIRARLVAQVAEFTKVASLAGEALPALQPTASEIAAVTPALGDLGDMATSQLLRTASTTLDAADAALAGRASVRALSAVPTTAGGGLPSAPGQSAAPARVEPSRASISRWPVLARNAIVYGVCTLVATGLQAAWYLASGGSASPLYVPLLLLLPPALAWLAGWLLIGGLFTPPGATPVNRTPRLGAIVCYLPDLLFCGGLVTTFIGHLFG